MTVPDSPPELAGLGVACLALSLAATPLAMRLARRVGLYDRPGALKLQEEPVPYLGGLGVAVAVALAVALGRPLLAVPLALALALGIADDARGLPPLARLGGEVVIGALVAVAVPTRLPSVLGPLAEIAAVVVVVNGVNMIDGLDGLAGGAGAVSAVGFAIVLVGPGELVAVGLAAGLIGFLAYNRPPARVYLGDGGTYLVGAALAALLALAWQPGLAWSRSVGALALLGYPVADASFAVARRLLAHAPLTTGDRGHSYDRLVARGWPRARASGGCVALQGALVVIGVVASRLPLPAAAVLVAASAAALAAGAAAAGFLTPEPLAPGPPERPA
ncbi:MAG: hypothetical protein ACRD0L_09945 [Acidimicrobiales bacterium]